MSADQASLRLRTLCVLQRLDDHEQRSKQSQRMPEYLSTHPATQDRVKEARARAAAAAPLLEISDCEQYRGLLRSQLDKAAFQMERSMDSIAWGR